MQGIEILSQHLGCQRFGFLSEAADLLIDDLGRGVRQVFSLGHGMAQKDLLLVTGIGEWSQFFAHAPFGDHATRIVGGLLNILAGASRHIFGPIN